MSRRIDARYDDPLDVLWLAAAARCGVRQVVRSAEVFARWDPLSETLTLSSSEHFDADDSLAQLIFHELCHALVEGDAGWTRPDWGLENTDARDMWREHACLRLQAALAEPHGLRELLAPTTDHRAYYDALPPDALAEPSPDATDRVVTAARAGHGRATSGPWAADLEEALSATARIAAAVAPLAPAGSLWRRYRRGA